MKTKTRRRYALVVVGPFSFLASVMIVFAQSEKPLVTPTEKTLNKAASLEPRKEAEMKNYIDGVHDFDFLVGEWRVHHRRLKPDSQEWGDFEGTCSNRKLMDGAANMEEHTLNGSKGAYRAVALRAYNSKTGQWAIWWLDGRYPSGPLDPPVQGRFENGVGTFYADDTLKGKPIRVRFLWTRVTSDTPRWEQAFSVDAGKTWETNWIMDFTKAQ